MKKILPLLFLLASGSIHAQTLDSLSFEESVKRTTTDKESKYYYPLLLQKLTTNNLSDQDYFYLYYGQIYAEGYRPFKIYSNPQMKPFYRYVTKGNCKQVVPIGTNILKSSPLDLTVLLHTCTCIRNNNLPDSQNLIPRFTKLLEAILSTGDGRSTETAIKIVNIQDDHVMKGILGFLGGQESLSVKGKQTFSVWTNGNDTLYFEDILNVKFPE